MNSSRKYNVHLPLAVAFLAAGALVAGCGSSSSSTVAKASAAAESKPAVAQSQQVKLEILTSGGTGSRAEWPRYVPATFSVKAGQSVTLTIVNHDEGAAPLAEGMAQMYDKVEGGKETVDGKEVTSVPNANVSHTFTVPGLGVNAVVPVAPKGATNTIVITFTPSKAGTYVWHCYAPCGEGKEGNMGAMSTQGYMEGKVTVLA